MTGARQVVLAATRRKWLVALGGAALATLAAGTIARLANLRPIDDAYISLRYAANWAAGRGLVFNPSETVEGYSNFLMVALEAAAIRCGADPVVTMVSIGQICLAGLGALLALFAFTHVFPGRMILAFLTGALAGLNPVLVAWAHSGMESCLFALLVLGALSAALAGCSARWTLISALCLVLAGLTRLEAVVVFPIIWAAHYYRCRAPRLTLLYAAIMIAGFGSYFAVRAVHFGYLLPNTFYAKLDYGNANLAERGLLYVWDFIVGNPALSLLTAAALALSWRAPLWLKASLAVLVAQWLAAIYEGGDHFALFRFLAPSVPFFILVGLYALALILRWRAGLPQHALVGVSLAAIAASSFCAAFQPKRGQSDPPFPPTQLGCQQFGCDLTEYWAELGRYLKRSTPGDASIVAVPIGAIGYFSERTIIDPHGIVDPAIAHLKQPLGQGYTGHEKYDVRRVLERRPGYFYLEQKLEPIPEALLSEIVWGDFYRALLRDPDMKRNYRYEIIVCGHLYVSLLVRRDLPRLPVF